MSTKTLQLTDELHAYLLRATVSEPDVLRELREETARLPNAQMQISPEQGQFMTLLCELIGARRAIEIGTFTGYSSICVASALPDDGKLIACDVSDEWTRVARRYWARAGVDKKIDLRHAPALDTLDALIADGQSGTIDFAFIDADKATYGHYYDRCLTLLRPGGLMALDNALRDGRVVDSEQDADTIVISKLNERVRDDDRVTSSLVPIGDGLLLARKR
jgi:caffeoyl-CoA O-methyltransferase